MWWFCGAAQPCCWQKACKQRLAPAPRKGDVSEGCRHKGDADITSLSGNNTTKRIESRSEAFRRSRSTGLEATRGGGWKWRDATCGGRRLSAEPPSGGCDRMVGADGEGEEEGRQPPRAMVEEGLELVRCPNVMMATWQGTPPPRSDSRGRDHFGHLAPRVPGLPLTHCSWRRPAGTRAQLAACAWRKLGHEIWCQSRNCAFFFSFNSAVTETFLPRGMCPVSRACGRATGCRPPERPCRVQTDHMHRVITVNPASKLIG